MRTAYQQLIAHLARRDYSEYKLREKLEKAEFSRDDIDEAFNLAKSRHEFDEFRYIEARIRGLIKKGNGPLQIQLKLSNENINLPKEEIERVIFENEISIDEIKDSLKRKFELRHAHLGDSRERENKFKQYLYQKGF